MEFLTLSHPPANLIPLNEKGLDNVFFNIIYLFIYSFFLNKGCNSVGLSGCDNGWWSIDHYVDVTSIAHAETHIYTCLKIIKSLDVMG